MSPDKPATEPAEPWRSFLTELDACLTGQGERYIIVDDFVGQGGTLANLIGYIESQGGQAVRHSIDW
jgi:adenine/guanine phosphoribosyltransferase-like PRPP-binding protein